MRAILGSGKEQRRRGVVIPLVALCLVIILAFTALAVDGGFLLADRRNLQGAADAAALAAAIDLYENYSTNSGTDPNSTAKTSAQDTAKDYGYADGKNNVTVTVNIPPKSGDYVGKAGYVEVIIVMQQQRFFSNVIGSGNMPVSARAVAVGGGGTEGNGIIILAPTGSNTLQASHSGTINVTGGNIIVDSSDENGMHLSATGNIQANNIYVDGPLQSPNPGGYSSSTGQVILNDSTKVQSGYAADPLKTLAAPSVPNTNYGNVQINSWNPGAQVSNGQTYGNVSGNTITLNPGYYSGGLTINDNNSAHKYVLSSGVYYFGGNVQISNFAGTMTDNGNGVCLYLASGGFTYSSNSGSSPSISLPTISSGTYSGYPVIYQSHGSPYGTSADTSDFQFSGGGTINVSGTIYLPFTNRTTLSHTGTINLTGQLISNTLNLSNTGNFNVTYSGAAANGPGTLYLVE
jgi:hypothetical protein